MALNLRPGPNGDSMKTLVDNLLQMKKAHAAFWSASALHGRNYQHLASETADACREADAARRLHAYSAMGAFITEYENALIAAQKGE